MTQETELAPAAFGNRINSLRHEGLLRPDFNWREWRKSPEWKLFVAGYNSCVEQCNAKVKAQYNLGEAAHRIFGGERDE